MIFYQPPKCPKFTFSLSYPTLLAFAYPALLAFANVCTVQCKDTILHPSHSCCCTVPYAPPPSHIHAAVGSNDPTTPSRQRVRPQSLHDVFLGVAGRGGAGRGGTAQNRSKAHRPSAVGREPVPPPHTTQLCRPQRPPPLPSQHPRATSTPPPLTQSHTALAPPGHTAPCADHTAHTCVMVECCASSLVMRHMNSACSRVPMSRANCGEGDGRAGGRAGG